MNCDRADNRWEVDMTFSTDTVEIVRESLVVEIETPFQQTEGSGHKIVITVDAKSRDVVDAYVCSVEMLTQAFLTHMHPPYRYNFFHRLPDGP